MTITIDQEKNKKVLFVCEYNRGTQEVTTISWSSTLHSNCEKCEIVKLKFSWFWSFPLQVTYLKNFSLFVEPKVETLGIQEHVSLGKTLVSNWFWWNAWNINISKKLQYRWENGVPKYLQYFVKTTYIKMSLDLPMTQFCEQVTREMVNKVMEGATSLGPNPKIFLRRIFPVQVRCLYSLYYSLYYNLYSLYRWFALTFVFATGRDRWPATPPPCHRVEGEMSINISWLTHNLTFVSISTIIINTIITIIITVTTMTDADAYNHFQGWWAPYPHQRLPRPRHTGVAAWLLCVNKKGIDVYDILKSWQHFPILCFFIRGIDFLPEETLALTLTSSSSTTSTWSTSHSCQRCLAIIITTMFLIYHQFLPKVEGKRTFEFEIALKTKSNEVIFHF